MGGQTLYIIGNGFDLYHRLNTSYQSFAFYLQNKYPHIHENLVNYYGLPWLEHDNPDDHRNPLWSFFEKALADLDFQTVLDDYSDYAANPGSEDFRSRDWHSYQIEMERMVSVLTTDLRSAFKNFICSVYIPSDPQVELLPLSRNATFLNFNYTSTLEKVYGIKHSNINYIHGFALNSHSEIILGHGADSESFIPEPPSPPEGLTDEEIQEWYDRGEDGYEYSYDEAQKEILGYFAASQKLTTDIIQYNRAFFDSLSNISEIIVIGHSIGEVDHEYFKKILTCVRSDAKWVVTYFSESGRTSIVKNLKAIGLGEDRYTLVRMKDSVPSQPSLFDLSE